jgi:hypothetical protein
MSLKKLKKKLTVDQVNILTATVISDGDDTVRIRTRSGKKIDAVKTAGTEYSEGDHVEIHTNGSTFTVTGTASLARLSGEKVVTV